MSRRYLPIPRQRREPRANRNDHPEYLEFIRSLPCHICQMLRRRQFGRTEAACIEISRENGEPRRTDASQFWSLVDYYRRRRAFADEHISAAALEQFLERLPRGRGVGHVLFVLRPSTYGRLTRYQMQPCEQCGEEHFGPACGWRPGQGIATAYSALPEPVSRILCPPSTFWLGAFLSAKIH